MSRRDLGLSRLCSSEPEQRTKNREQTLIFVLFFVHCSLFFLVTAVDQTSRARFIRACKRPRGQVLAHYPRPLHIERPWAPFTCRPRPGSSFCSCVSAVEPPEFGRSMAASEHAIGTDLAGPGAEALSCDELHRRDCHATIHLSGTHSLHEGRFGSSSLLHSPQAYHDNGGLVKQRSLRL